MGKREIETEVSQIQVSKHACNRYRQRVAFKSFRHARQSILMLLKKARPVVRKPKEDGSAGVTFMKTGDIVLVVGNEGVVRTLFREGGAEGSDAPLKKQRRAERRRRKKSSRRRNRYLVGRYGYQKPKQAE